MRALVDAFNQDKALVGAFSMFVKTDGSFAALVSSSNWHHVHNKTVTIVPFVGPEVCLETKRPWLSQYFYYKFPCVESRYPTTPLPS